MTRINNTWQQAKIENSLRTGAQRGRKKIRQPKCAVKREKKNSAIPLSALPNLRSGVPFFGHLIAGRLWTPDRRLGSPRSPWFSYFHFILGLKNHQDICKTAQNMDMCDEQGEF